MQGPSIIAAVEKSIALGFDGLIRISLSDEMIFSPNQAELWSAMIEELLLVLFNLSSARITMEIGYPVASEDLHEALVSHFDNALLPFGDNGIELANLAKHTPLPRLVLFGTILSEICKTASWLAEREISVDANLKVHAVLQNANFLGQTVVRMSETFL
ncbi:MAG: hypothetical protein OJJ21_03215 [Ferrovibrio sp.]|uniref:hypothetical protein n=1 Tax=Ferrovibrio sp. TaxID=1917215 RepID=UPI00262B019C|nr:hypothetical protein [Ferrovibrio sp.]MCW0232588.1 hypothetical protein [Ferrovibrio sp.]